MSITIKTLILSEIQYEVEDRVSEECIERSV